VMAITRGGYEVVLPRNADGKAKAAQVVASSHCYAEVVATCGTG